MKSKEVKLNNQDLVISNSRPFTLIAGVCSIEDEKSTLQAAEELKDICLESGVKLIFKASYDKANRSSGSAYRGPGIKAGLRILEKVKNKYGLPVLTDVHTVQDAAMAASTADVLQVPAFLCRQTDLVMACARTALPVNIKKGQFLAPEDMLNIIKKVESAGNKKIILTERGASFGYHNLVVDFRGLEIMKSFAYPVVFDATHSVQIPGGLGTATGGASEFIMPLSKAACAVGVAGIFIEVHRTPSKAKSDGANSLKISQVKKYLSILRRFDKAAKV